MPAYAHAQIASLSGSNVIGIRMTGNNPLDKPTKLGVAIDTSGSMSGSRIDSVKRCLKVVINRLRVGDTITVVGFSDAAQIILPNFTVTPTNRSDALNLIDGLVADGGTNAESAITALGSMYQTGKPDAVLFLTDGHINQGISSISGLISLINSYISGVPFYTLGYGEGHNADLLRRLALRTKATYTFAEDEMALPASMGELLASLQYEVAKKVTFVIPAGWTCLEPNYDSTDSNYEFGSIIADKPTWALFSVGTMTREQIGNSLSLTVQYSDLSAQTVQVVFDDTMDSLVVVEQDYRCTVGKAMDSVANYLDRGNTTGAKTLLTATISTLKSNSAAAARPLVIRMIAQLEELLEECNNYGYSTPPTRSGASMRSPPPLSFRTRGLGANYSAQRDGSSVGATPDYMFSSPTVIRATSQMVDDYSDANARDADPMQQSSV
jgi:hypothetical protein